jgi:hypothetical protein
MLFSTNTFKRLLRTIRTYAREVIKKNAGALVVAVGRHGR